MPRGMIGDVPDARRFVFRARDDVAAIGAESHAEDSAGVSFELHEWRGPLGAQQVGPPRPSIRDVPDTRRVVPGAGYHPARVGAEHRATQLLDMSLEFHEGNGALAPP